jgi:hypothetical protein
LGVVGCSGWGAGARWKIFSDDDRVHTLPSGFRGHSPHYV